MLRWLMPAPIIRGGSIISIIVLYIASLIYIIIVLLVLSTVQLLNVCVSVYVKCLFAR